MAFNYSRLTDIKTIGNTTTDIYTNLVNKTAYIRMVLLHNTNSATDTVELYCVPSGSVAGVTNKIYKESIPAGESRIIEFPVPGLILKSATEKLQAVCTTTSVVTITVTGGLE